MSRIRAHAFVAALLVTVSLSPLMAQAQYQDDADNADDSAHAGSGGSAARLQVRINELEEQVRRLQGAMEQTSFTNRQLKTQMDKMKGDIEYRLNALEKNPTAAAPAAVNDTPAPNTQLINTTGDETPNKYVPETKTVAPKPVSEPAADAQPGNVQNFPSSHEHYSYGFQLVNKGKYAEASDVFTAFTQRYPKDPLIGHAYFWLGETFYVRKDYAHAADSYRQGYEAMPAGPKAADNLLKLAMALGASGKDKESCTVLKTVNTKFSKTSGSIKSRVEQEMTRTDCK